MLSLRTSFLSTYLYLESSDNHPPLVQWSEYWRHGCLFGFEAWGSGEWGAPPEGMVPIVGVTAKPVDGLVPISGHAIAHLHSATDDAWEAFEGTWKDGKPHG